jgi:hypothetical protein
MSQATLCLSKLHARQIETHRVFYLINMYKELWQVRAIEAGGFGSKKCCMQQKRCITFMLHAFALCSQNIITLAPVFTAIRWHARQIVLSSRKRMREYHKILLADITEGPRTRLGVAFEKRDRPKRVFLAEMVEEPYRRFLAAFLLNYFQKKLSTVCPFPDTCTAFCCVFSLHLTITV